MPLCDMGMPPIELGPWGPAIGPCPIIMACPLVM